MNSPSHFPRRIFLAGAFFCALACAFAARAQEQPNPAPAPGEASPESAAAPETPVGYVSTGRNPTSVFTENTNSDLAEAATAGPAQRSPFQWGPVGLDPHPSYGIFYTDGILVVPGEAVSTTRQSFSPGFLLQLGPHWTLDYTPTWEDYSNSFFHDGFDQAARLEGMTTLNDWNLQFSQDYASTYDPLVETGRQTREDSYVTGFKAVYQSGNRTLLELGVNQNIQLSPVSPDAYEWSTLDWLHHPLGPQWDAAIGGGFAYIVMDPGYDMTALRPEARLTWQTTGKLSFDLQGGIEHRTFVGSDGSDLNTFIYNASAVYQPWEATKLIASANRDVEPGYAENQVDDVANLSLSLQQRLLQHFFLGAALGRQKVDYIQVGGIPLAVRSDDATTFQLSLNTVLLRRLSLALQYSRVLNDSDVAGFGFASNQYGVTILYKY